MSQPKSITRGPWTCTGSDGKQYQVMEQVAIMRLPHFEGGDSPATHTSSQYNTTDGRFLIRLGKGKYRIEETDIILQANDPNAT